MLVKIKLKRSETKRKQLQSKVVFAVINPRRGRVEGFRVERGCRCRLYIEMVALDVRQPMEIPKRKPHAKLNIALGAF